MEEKLEQAYLYDFYGDIRRIHELTNDFKKSHNELLMNEIEAISNQILEEL